jgi:conjugal transfer mating pair stabilization protein TraN
VGYKYIIAGLLFLNGSSLKETKKEGEQYGKTQNKTLLESIKDFDVESLRGSEDEPFEAEEAKEQLKKQQIPDSELKSFLESPDLQKNYQTINKDEYYFQRSDEITSYKNESVETKNEEAPNAYTYETCLEVGAPFTMELIRTLQLEVESKSKEREERICLGHHEDDFLYWGSRSDALQWIVKRKEELSLDASLETYDAYIHEHKRGEYYIMRAEWKHYSDCSHCKAYTSRMVQDELIEEVGQQWVYEDSSKAMLETPECTLVERVCLDSAPRIIKGKEFQKQCWVEKLVYLCRKPKSDGCAVLREKKCHEVERKCVQEGELGCGLWEVTYKCLNKNPYQPIEEPSDLYGLQESTWETTKEPNSSFASIATKLSLFDEMKKDIEEQNARDATKIQIFKGKEMKCSKSVADELLYDCCFAFGGISTKLKLSQCSEEELSLAEMREKGLCHYVGKYSQEFMDLWKTRDEHVYCCFTSKLSRVFQEEAREQLKMDWGKPKEPNCRGFLTADIDKLDFTTLDLNEAFDQTSKEFEKRLQEKVERMQPRIKERIDKEVKNEPL